MPVSPVRSNADCSSTTTCVTLDADYYSPLKRNVLKRYVYLKEVLQADVMTSIPVSPPRRVRTPILICPSAKEEENGCFGGSPINALQPPIPIAVDDADVDVSCGSGNGSCEGDLGNEGSLSGLGCLEKSESVVCQEVKSVPDALQKECVDGVNHDVFVRDDIPEGDKGVEDAVAGHEKPVAMIASETSVAIATTEHSKPVTATVPEIPNDAATTEHSDSIAVTTEQNKPVTMSVPEKPVEIATTEQNKPTATPSTKQSNPQPSPNHPPQNASPPVTAATTPPNKPSFFSLLFKWFHFFSHVS